MGFRLYFNTKCLRVYAFGVFFRMLSKCLRVFSILRGALLRSVVSFSSYSYLTIRDFLVSFTLALAGVFDLSVDAQLWSGEESALGSKFITIVPQIPIFVNIFYLFILLFQAVVLVARYNFLS